MTETFRWNGLRSCRRSYPSMSDLKHNVKRHLFGSSWIRIGLAVLCTMLALIMIAFIPISEIESIVTQGTYWLSILLLSLFAYFAFRCRRKVFVSEWRHRYLWWPLVAGIWLLCVHAEFGPKVVLDDYILAASADRLATNQEYAVSMNGYWHEGEFEFAAPYLDKRPWLYPALCAYLHQLTGWRFANAYIINILAGLLLLYCIIRVGFDEAGLKGAWLGMLGLISIPLFAQSATGGGMDLVNMLFLLIVILAGGAYIRAPSRGTEGFFTLAMIALCYARYESALYLLPGGILLIAGWVRARVVLLSWPTVFAPLLLVSYFLQSRFFRASEKFWELPEAIRQPFGLENLLPNLGSAFYFFLNLDAGLGNSAILSVCGFIALIALVFAGPGIAGWGRQISPSRAAFYVFAPFILINFFILMCYHFGELDRIQASRLSLPLYLMLLLALLSVGSFIFRRNKCGVFVLAAFAVYVVGWSLPHNSRELFSKRNYVANELQWLLEEVAPHIESRDLVIDHKSTPWTLYKKASLKPAYFFDEMSWVQTRFERGLYENIYFVERLEYELKDGHLALAEVNYPSGSVELELLVERSFRPFSTLRISRVRALHPDQITEDFKERGSPRGHVADYSYNGL